MPSQRLDFKQVDTTPNFHLEKSKIFVAKSTSLISNFPHRHAILVSLETKVLMYVNLLLT